VYYNENMNAIHSKTTTTQMRAVKTKNAPFFMNFPNLSFLHRVFSDWTGALK
jgi:hypothetical protein